MESYIEDIGSVQKFWVRRLVSQLGDEEATADVLLENQFLFPPAQVELEGELTWKSQSSSLSCVPCAFNNVTCECRGSCSSSSEDLQDVPDQINEDVPGIERYDGRNKGDIPCSYTFPKCEDHEMTAVGVYIDHRILPGFTYRVRPLSFSYNKTKWLFGGKGRELESVGRGYSRRITLKPLSGQINSNNDYFWTDSNSEGFAFSIQVLKPNDKFTLFDADQQPVGQVEITHTQGCQTELSQKVHKDGRVEKVVKVRALCKVDWFHEQDNKPIIPLTGTCLCVREGKGSGRLVNIRDVKLGPHHGYSLVPGTCSSLRSLKVTGIQNSDVPTSYTIVGIDTHHLPVIGTFVDERILPGFHYRVQLAGCGRKLFGGRALRLDSLGRGYAKRITFKPEVLNSPEEHFWSDSHPEGYGFEVSAVRNGMRFIIKTKDTEEILGHAHVFRDDCAPQVELQTFNLDDKSGAGVSKRIQIDVKCVVSLDLSTKEDLEPHVMRVSGVATLHKSPKETEAKLVKIEDIGLDSQLNILFFNQWQELIFYPCNDHYTAPHKIF